MALDRRRPGRPRSPVQLYQPDWMPRIVGQLCARGATMSELAEALNIASSTLYLWINRHEALRTAIQVNADIFNPRVERALAERALGFWITLQPEERDPETGEVITPAQRQYYPPDTTACIFFLKNRMKEKYKDVHKVENEVKLLKTSEQLMIEVRKDILDLKAQGYDPKLIEHDQRETPKKGNGHG